MPYYPTELDSDDEGSIEYDWDNDSQIDDDDLSSNMGRLQLEQTDSAVPATPPPRYSSLASLTPNNAAGPLCVVSRLFFIGCALVSLFTGMQTEASIQ